jgi:hypothetical protein
LPNSVPENAKTTSPTPAMLLNDRNPLLVRDEGVAGSNPATPTSFSYQKRLTGNDMGDETRFRTFETA